MPGSSAKGYPDQKQDQFQPFLFSLSAATTPCMTVFAYKLNTCWNSIELQQTEQVAPVKTAQWCKAQLKNTSVCALHSPNESSLLPLVLAAPVVQLQLSCPGQKS